MSTTISSGQLDSLVGTSFTETALSLANFVSGTATGSSVNTVTATTTGVAYGETGLNIISVNDKTNTIVVEGQTAAIGGYGSGSQTVDYVYTVVGVNGSTL